MGVFSPILRDARFRSAEPESATFFRPGIYRVAEPLAPLWQEYKEAHPQRMQRSWFCKLHRAWTAKLDVVMRQERRAGEKLFVDT